MQRWAEFLIQQERFIRRREKMYRRGWLYELQFVPPGHPFPSWVRIGRGTPLWSGGRQTKKAMSPEAKHIQLLPWAILNPGGWTLRRIGARKTPVPDIHPFGQNGGNGPGTKHLRLPQVGYHRRRVKRVGHKPDRMNGFQRKCWGAAYFAYVEGYFPDWDPLQGRPNLADFLAGDPGVSGIFRQTPR